MFCFRISIVIEIINIVRIIFSIISINCWLGFLWIVICFFGIFMMIIVLWGFVLDILCFVDGEEMFVLLILLVRFLWFVVVKVVVVGNFVWDLFDFGDVVLYVVVGKVVDFGVVELKYLRLLRMKYEVLFVLLMVNISFLIGRFLEFVKYLLFMC